MADVLGRESGHVVRPEDRAPIVTNWTGPTDWSNCPPTYEAWYAQYLPEAVYWVRRCGINWREVDDVVAELMVRFQERASLEVFSGDWESRSKTGRSQFRSYFSNFVVSYAPGKNRNNVRYIKKHSFIFDAPIGGEDDGATWGEVNAPAHEEDVIERLSFEAAIASVREQVQDDELVDAVLMLATEGVVRQSGLRTKLGRNARDSKNGLDVVRDALRDALASAS